jgi:hypothetical protein
MKAWQLSIEQTTQKGAVEMISVHENMSITIEQTTQKRGTRNDIGS